MKYAVIRTGGKQYRVAEGDLVKVEKLAGEVGEQVVLPDVLFVGGEEVKIGAKATAASAAIASIRPLSKLPASKLKAETDRWHTKKQAAARATAATARGSGAA